MRVAPVPSTENPPLRKEENGCGPRVRGAGKSYVWPEGGIDAWLENKHAALEEAITRHEAMGQVPI